MLCFAEFSSEVSDGFIFVAPIVGVHNYGISCSMCFKILKVYQFLGITEAAVFANTWFEEFEPLMPFSKITIDIFNFFWANSLVLETIAWCCIQTVRKPWSSWSHGMGVVIDVVIESIGSGTIVNWLLFVLGFVSMAHGRASLAIDVKGTWSIRLPCFVFLTLISALSLNMILFSVLLSVLDENYFFFPPSVVLRRGSKLSGSSYLDEISVLVCWALRLANWDCDALLINWCCLLCRLGENGADVLRADSVSLASVLCALCFHFGLNMFCLADLLAGDLSTSLVRGSFMSSLQLVSKFIFFNLMSSKLIHSKLRSSFLLLCFANRSFTAVHSIALSWSGCLRLFFAVDDALDLFGRSAVLENYFLLHSIYSIVLAL